MEQLFARTACLFEEPYDDRDGRDKDLSSVRYVVEEMDTTVLRARKLLITAGYLYPTFLRFGVIQQTRRRSGSLRPDPGDS